MPKADLLSPEELQELRVECYFDRVLFCRTFLREWFHFPMSWAHRGLLALLSRRADFLLHFGEEDWPEGPWVWDQDQLELILKYFVWSENPDDPKALSHPLFLAERDAHGRIVRLDLLASRKVLLMLPRGIGKTTVVNAANLISILYEDIKFLVYVSESATHAETQLGNIKRQLETNQLIHQVFGQLKPDRNEGLKWTEGFIETRRGVAVFARGRGAQVRGMLHNGQRPDRIVLDDVEDKESVSTDAQRSKTKVWFKADLEPALPQMSKTGEIFAVGTLLDPDALLMMMLRSKEWISARFGGVVDGIPLAPFYMTAEQFEAKKDSFIDAGMLAEFWMEYGSEIRLDGDQRKFRAEDIRYQIMKPTEFIGIGEMLDPAISEDRRADFAAIGVVGMGEKGQIHVLDMWEKRGASPRELVDKYFQLHYIWKPTKHGVETIAYQAALVHLMQEEMFRQRRQDAYFEIIKVGSHGYKGKIMRVEGILAPRYRAGYITHQRRFLELEKQLLEWPLGKKDCPDVLAMAVALLDPYAATGAFDPDNPEAANPLLKDEYPPLDMVLQGKSFQLAP